MPLPPPVARAPKHRRQIECRGYLREDGLYDIEGHLVDTKEYDFIGQSRGPMPAGTPLHDMWVRMTIGDDYVIRDIVACTDASPYRICPEAAPALKAVIGLKIAAGWLNKAKLALGRADTCTHLRELLGPLATTAYQTMEMLRPGRHERRVEGRPPQLNSCYAYREDGEVVALRWPDHYTGPIPAPAEKN